jgi:hypothetical protein
LIQRTRQEKGLVDYRIAASGSKGSDWAYDSEYSTDNSGFGRKWYGCKIIDCVVADRINPERTGSGNIAEVRFDHDVDHAGGGIRNDIVESVESYGSGRNILRALGYAVYPERQRRIAPGVCVGGTGGDYAEIAQGDGNISLTGRKPSSVYRNSFGSAGNVRGAKAVRPGYIQNRLLNRYPRAHGFTCYVRRSKIFERHLKISRIERIRKIRFEQNVCRLGT